MAGPAGRAVPGRAGWLVSALSGTGAATLQRVRPVEWTGLPSGSEICNGEACRQAGQSRPAAIAEQEARKAPKLRCWQDEKRNLHLASNLAGAYLVRAVERLSSSPSSPSSMSVVLAMADEPFSRSTTPCGPRACGDVFTRLRLELGACAWKRSDDRAGGADVCPRAGR